jgi:hypothetical protein
MEYITLKVQLTTSIKTHELWGVFTILHMKENYNAIKCEK